jgi:DNA-binding XRE family transcriptional regulator
MPSSLKIGIGDVCMLENQLKQIRMQEYMMNRREFCTLLGINESQYSRYESGNAQPSLEVAIKVALALKKQVTDIWCINNDSV